MVTSVGPEGRECKETFDFLVVATGLNQTCSGLQLGAPTEETPYEPAPSAANRLSKGRRSSSSVSARARATPLPTLPPSRRRCT
eukprot:g9439.t1